MKKSENTLICEALAKDYGGRWSVPHLMYIMSCHKEDWRVFDIPSKYYLLRVAAEKEK